MKQFPLSVQFYQKMEQAVVYNAAKLENCAFFGKQGFPSALSVHALWACGKSKGAASGTFMRSC